MKKVTDKYHRLGKEDEKFFNPFFDVKDVSRRTYQLGLAALFTGVGLSIYDSYLGLYVSSFLVACFCFAILIVMLLKYNGDIPNLTIFIISIVSGLLIAMALIEGLRSEQYLYFFPILVAVPIIVDLKQTQYRQSFIYISIIILSFMVCILISRNMTPMEEFTISQTVHLAFVNRMIAISSTIVFAVAYIFFEKKYINQIMEQSSKVIDARTQFLATMGHELRTPLNGIIGVINLLKYEDSTPKREEYYQVLKYCSDHMLQQVNNILDFNKIEANKLEIHPVQLNLRQLLLNVGMPFVTTFQEKDLELKIDIDPRLDALVYADDLRLIQVFNNLFSNALKFTERGYVSLNVTCTSKDEQTLKANFSVEDTGIGIEDKNQKRIFESFWQVYDEDTKKFVGTGLGLTICVRLLKLMGSSLRLQSEIGKGSRFSFDLEFKCAHNSPKPAKSPAETKDNLSGVRILIAEDNQLNMMIASRMLTGFKASITMAYNGQEALDILAKDQDYDVILMDLEMPVMNGYTAIYEIKKSYPQIPVIAFTASLVDQKMLSDLVASGFADCMLKPFQPHQMLTSIKKYLLKPVLATR